MTTFTLDDAQEKRIKWWQQKHGCRYRDPITGKRNGGVSDNLDNYCFTPTSAGMVVAVVCACGSVIDVTPPL